MERDKIHIIFSGDSFSDDGTRLDIYEHSLINLESVKYQNTPLPDTIKPHHLLAYDLINDNNFNVTIHTLGRGSYGNHVIADKFKKKVLEIKNNYPNEKIYGVIQFSAFIRQGFKAEGVDIDLDDYPYDYLKHQGIIESDLEKEIFEKHFENIENLNQFCIDNDVKKYMYFGWANIFTNDIERLHLEKRFKSIKNIVNFYQYKDSYDEIEHYCSGRKPASLKNFLTFGKNKLFYSLGDDYGGLTEYTRDKLDIGHRYVMPFDPHPSTEAYYVFYTQILKKWLSENGIIQNGPMEYRIESMLKNVFKLEYLKFTMLTNAGKDNLPIIYNEIKSIIDTDKVTDIEYITNTFKKLNRTF
jgi:hypothetical protein